MYLAGVYSQFECSVHLPYPEPLCFGSSFINAQVYPKSVGKVSRNSRTANEKWTMSMMTNYIGENISVSEDIDKV